MLPLEALIELYAHQSVAVQSQAAWALGEIGSKRVVEILGPHIAPSGVIPVITALKVGSCETLAQLTLD